MTEEQKKNKEQFENCCEGIAFDRMMEAMMSRKEELCGCGCMEMMKKTRPKSFSPRKQENETPG